MLDDGDPSSVEVLAELKKVCSEFTSNVEEAEEGVAERHFWWLHPLVDAMAQSGLAGVAAVNESRQNSGRQQPRTTLKGSQDVAILKSSRYAPTA